MHYRQNKDHYLERDFEDAILRELELFLLELGAGFSFIARQKRIQLNGGRLLYRSLVLQPQSQAAGCPRPQAGQLPAEYKGQMELYLSWLAKYERVEGDAPPLGIILCAGASSKQIELQELDAAGIHVAEYLTGLPDCAGWWPCRAG